MKSHSKKVSQQHSQKSPTVDLLYCLMEFGIFSLEPVNNRNSIINVLLSGERSSLGCTA